MALSDCNSGYLQRIRILALTSEENFKLRHYRLSQQLDNFADIVLLE